MIFCGDLTALLLAQASQDPEAQTSQTQPSSWFAKLSTALPSVAEAAAAATAGDLNALSKAATSAQQGLQQGITDFTGKAKERT
eukprot:g26130.t1